MGRESRLEKSSAAASGTEVSTRGQSALPWASFPRLVVSARTTDAASIVASTIVETVVPVVSVIPIVAIVAIIAVAAVAEVQADAEIARIVAEADSATVR